MPGFKSAKLVEAEFSLGTLAHSLEPTARYTRSNVAPLASPVQLISAVVLPTALTVKPLGAPGMTRTRASLVLVTEVLVSDGTSTLVGGVYVTVQRT